MRFASLPSSLACRPWAVLISTTGRSLKPGGDSLAWTQTYQLNGAAGRAVIRVPLYSMAPYSLIVSAVTGQGRRSKVIRMNVACPSTGCLHGDAPALHEQATPRRFPLRNITLAELQRSFLAGLEAAARAAPYMKRTGRCPSRTACEVTYTDPLFPRQPYRTRYEIAGEQTAGCWFVARASPLTTPPYEDIFARGPEAGCITWHL